MKMKIGPGGSIESECGSVKIDKDGTTPIKTEKGSVSASYREQFDRLKRSHQRLEKLDKGTTYDMHSEDYQDEIYVFFMNCHHLKDWLIKDSQFSASKNEVESYINSNKQLQICADICNAHKHFRLETHRSEQQPSVGGQTIAWKLGAREVAAREIIVKVKFTIDTASGPLDGFELATCCLDLWKTFILKKGGNA